MTAIVFELELGSTMVKISTDCNDVRAFQAAQPPAIMHLGAAAKGRHIEMKQWHPGETIRSRVELERNFQVVRITPSCRKHASPNGVCRAPAAKPASQKPKLPPVSRSR
jgi:hypothetical protein